jgi:hypothetical protein
MDGDGKLILLVNFGPYVIDNSVSILRNSSSGSSVSFEPKIDFKIREPESVFIADLDGDGKLDFAVTNPDVPTYSLVIYRNTSSPGNISFASPLSLVTPSGLNEITSTDIDGDGKPDIAVTANGLSVYRNISDPGMLAFAPRVSFSFAGSHLISSDIDKDGKPDMIGVNASTDDFNILRNTSTKGNISFATGINIPATSLYYLAAGDVDGDGKTHLVASNIVASQAAVFRNTGPVGNMLCPGSRISGWLFTNRSCVE